MGVHSIPFSFWMNLMSPRVVRALPLSSQNTRSKLRIECHEMMEQEGRRINELRYCPGNGASDADPRGRPGHVTHLKATHAKNAGD